MLQPIRQTRMTAGAKASLLLEKKPRKPIIDILIFLLVSAIATVPQNIISSFAVILCMLTDPEFYTLFSEGIPSSDVITQYGESLINNIPNVIYAVILLSSGFMILAAILYCRIFEKRKADTLGFTKENRISEYLSGAAVGAVMITAPTLICLITGSANLTAASPIKPLSILCFFIAILIQGMGEEALFRGYLMTSLCRKMRPAYAVLLSALLFALFHTGNASFSFLAFVNIMLFGIFAGIFMLKRGSIWAVGAVHSIWNFVQGNVFGFQVSGNPKFDTVFEITTVSGRDILHGGSFGIEGGLCATAILLAAIFVALLIPTKQEECVSESESSTEFI